MTGRPSVSNRLDLADPDRAHWIDAGAPRPVRVSLWLPDASGPAPLVLISHGTGGCAEDFAGIAEGLTAVGFAVAGVDHHGNTSTEPYVAEAFVSFTDRPRDFAVALDTLLQDARIDASRVGIFGFSLGGYTAAAVLGARLVPSRIRMLLDQPELVDLPEYPGLLLELTGRYGLSRLYATVMRGWSGEYRDARVRAGMVVAPVLGFAFAEESLAAIAAPVRVLWGDADQHAPAAAGALPLLQGIPNASGRSLGDAVGHYEVISDPAVQQQILAEAVDHFSRALRPG